MRIMILRHGETDWNVCARLQGQTDIPLNENGIRLAKITGERMSDIPVDICFTSPLVRARKTAELVLAGRNIPVYDDTRLMEISFGNWEGRRCGKQNSELPEGFLDAFYDKPFSITMPEGGETFEALAKRTADFLDELTAKKEYADKSILLSCHGCSSRALLYHMTEGICPEQFWRGVVPPNCSVSFIDYADGRYHIVEEDRVYYDKKDWKNYYAR